jgi:hypothetical protein
MPRETKIQTNFTGGEWSPTADARIDIDKYNNSCALIQNFWNHQVGGLLFRPGTIYAATVSNPSAGKVGLLKFVYSSSQAYAIEAGNEYFRFYINNGQLISNGSPVTLSTPYAIADVFSLRYAQQADTMYLVSALGTYQMQKLIRISATSFAINPVTTIGGPFRSTNISATTLTASSDTGAVTLTATVPAWSAGTQYTQGAFVTNGGNTYVCIVPNTASSSFATDLAAGLWQAGSVFNNGHVGAIFGIGPSSGIAGTVVITVYNSGTSVSGYVQNTPSGAAGNLNTSGAATTMWAEGSFSNYRGWPEACIFYEQRLYYVMGNTIYGSAIDAFDDFSAGTATATDAVDYQLLEELQNNIGWVVGSTFALKAGTTDGTFFISSGTNNTPISPSNILAQKHTGWGSSNLAPCRLYDAIYYASRDNMQLRELRWQIDIEADKSDDMTLVADHILYDGNGAVMIDEMAYPIPRIFVPRADGQIAVLTRNIDQQVMPWCRTIMGTSSGIPGIIESLVIIPTSNGSDQIWCSVYRIINGTPTRFIEYFTSERFVNPWDAVRMDAASVYNVPVTITGITKANPCVVTAPNHGFFGGIDSFVQLMLHLNNSLVDASQNNFSITNHGTTGYTASSPFNGVTDSASMNGSNQYLATPTSSVFNIGLSDFTIDVWVNPATVASASQGIYTQYVDSNNYFSISIDDQTVILQCKSSGTVIAYYATGNCISANAWQHIEVVKAGSTIYIFVNGVSQTLTVTTAIGSNPIPSLSTPVVIGNSNGGYFDGYMSELRVSIGIARNIANFTPPSVPYTNSNATTGTKFKIDNVVGMTQVNGNIYTIKNITQNQFTICDTNGNPIDSSAFNAYISGGAIRQMVTSITGLSYLNGETVVVSTDGGLPGQQQTFVVSNGAITLPTPAAVVNVGLPYQGLIKLQKFSGTAQGKMTRIYLSTVRVVNSLGLQVGTDLNNLSSWQAGSVNTPPGHPPALVTDDIEIRFPTRWSKTDQMYLVQNAPLPLFISGAIFRTEFEELD